MVQKKATCPHCQKENVFTEPSVEEKIMKNLPANILKAIGSTVFGALTGPIGGLLLGGVLYANNVIRFIDGVSVTCGNCSKDFKIPS